MRVLGRSQFCFWFPPHIFKKIKIKEIKKFRSSLDFAGIQNRKCLSRCIYSNLEANILVRTDFWWKIEKLSLKNLKFPKNVNQNENDR